MRAGVLIENGAIEVGAVADHRHGPGEMVLRVTRGGGAG